VNTQGLRTSVVCIAAKSGLVNLPLQTRNTWVRVE
jgi:hypothetical protein